MGKSPQRRTVRSEMRKERRRKRRKKIALSAGLAVVLGITGVGLYAYSNLQGKVTTVATDTYLNTDTRPTKAVPKVPNPTDKFEGALNILVIGSDVRSDDDSSTVTGMRSDTVMVVHVSENRDRVEIVSIPRDSWVTIPSCALPDGRMTPPITGKFNSAFALGGQTGDTGAGVACTIQTVEQLTNLYIDEFVVVDFNGFKELVDALGGVKFNVEHEINDPSFGNLHIQAGEQTFDGKTALKYARVRKAVGMDGSDLSRINRQQMLMSAIFDKAKTKITDPTAMYNLASAGLEMLTTSEDLGSINAMAGLGWKLKDVKSENIVFKTVPVMDRGDGSNVLWTSDAQVMWNHLIEDEPIEGLSYSNSQKPLDPNEVYTPTNHSDPNNQYPDKPNQAWIR